MRRYRRTALVLIVVAAMSTLFGAGYVISHRHNHQAPTPASIEVKHGSREYAMVAITFDQGSDEPSVREVLSVLDNYGIKGTFFPNADSVQKQSKLLRDLVADNQVIAATGPTSGAAPAGASQADIRKAAGVCPSLFGSSSQAVATPANFRESISWEVSGRDSSPESPTTLAQRVLQATQPGSIIRLQTGTKDDLATTTTAALPLVIQGLERAGLEPVSLDKLLGRLPYLTSC
jgi:hypothetical protein